jgi:hypothetical protein
VSGQANTGLTRRERSAIRKQAWAQANADLQVSFQDASAPIGATPEQRRATRERRKEARQFRDIQARMSAAAALEAAEQQKSVQGVESRPVPRQTAPRRQAAAIQEQTGQTWQAVRPPTRAQIAKANRAAWAQLQLDRLAQTAAARTARRGKRRQAKSQAHLAAQAARIQAGLESAGGLHSSTSPTTTQIASRARSQSTTQITTGKGGN